MRLYDQKKCGNQIYELQKQNFLYLNQWFHVNIYQYENLSDEQKERLGKSMHYMFLLKVLYSVKKDDLVDVSFLTNSYTDSLMTVVPSRLSNYANSQRETCYGLNNVEKYDPRCRQWFKDAYSQKRLIFSPPFLYQSTFNIGFVVTQRINDTDGSFLSMSNWNVGLANMKAKIFQKQDVYDESDSQEGYTILINNQNQTVNPFKSNHTQLILLKVYHHRYWKSNEKVLKQWGELEFNQSTYFNEFDRQEFNNNVNFISNYTLTGDYSIEERKNISQFYFRFKRNNQTYLTLLYPVLVMSIQNPKTKEIIWNKPMLIGRVQKDRTKIFEEITLEFLPFNKLLINCQLGLVIFWLIINLIHYTAFLFNQIDQQIVQLTYAIKNNIFHNSKKNLKLNTNAHQAQNNTSNQFLDSPQSKINGSQNQKSPVTREIVFFGDSFINTRKEQVNQTPKNQLKEQLQRGSLDSSLTCQALLHQNSRELSKLRLNKNYKTIGSVSTWNQSGNQSLTSISDQNSIYYLSEEKDSSGEQKKIDLDDINQTFLEMKIIVETIQGIFHLINLAKINSQKGNNDVSIIQFAQILNIFVKVKNYHQQIICYKKMGNQYLNCGRYEDAIIAYESGLNIVLMQFELSDYNQFLNYLMNSRFNKENKSYIQNFIFFLRMLSISQLFLHKNSQRSYLQLILKAQSNIVLCNQIAKLFPNQYPNYLFFLLDLIYLNTLYFTNPDLAFDVSTKLENNLLNYTNEIILQLSNKESKFQDINICKMIKHQAYLIKQQLLIDKGQLYQSSQNLTNLLEGKEYLDESTKYESLQLIQKIFYKANLDYLSEPVNNELNKYNKIQLKVHLIIEINRSISSKQFEIYLNNIQNFIKNNLQDEDEITFTVFDSEFTQICKPYQKKNLELTYYCLKEIKRTFLKYNEQQLFQRKITQLDLIQFILIKERFKHLKNPLNHIIKFKEDTSKIYYLIFQLKSQLIDLNESILSNFISKMKPHIDYLKENSINGINIFHIQNSNGQDHESSCRSMKNIDITSITHRDTIHQPQHTLSRFSFTQTFSHNKSCSNQTFLQVHSVSRNKIETNRQKRNSSKQLFANQDDSSCLKYSKSDHLGEQDNYFPSFFDNIEYSYYQKIKDFQQLSLEFDQIRYTKQKINQIYFI